MNYRKMIDEILDRDTERQLYLVLRFLRRLIPAGGQRELCKSDKAGA